MNDTRVRHRMRAALRRQAARADTAARPPTPADAVMLARLLLAAFRGSVDDEGETPEQALATVGQLFDGEFGSMMWSVSELSEHDGEAVAATLVTLFAGAPFVAFSVTHPHWQRQGRARAGLQRVMARLAAGDETELRLVVTEGNPAEALYASLGFVRVPDLRHARADPATNLEKTMNASLPAPQDVLDFWFGHDDRVDARWFNGGAAFDAAIRTSQSTVIDAALAGRLSHWPEAGPQAALALIVVLDQFTRNVHRGTPRAFAGDAMALATAQALVAGGADRQLPPLQRWFALMPFEHAEDAALQAQGVALFERLLADAAHSPHHDALASALDYARRHEAVVQRFGRFPHRNPILGRSSTAEELAFLAQPGSSF